MRRIGATIAILIALHVPTHSTDTRPQPSRGVDAAEIMKQVVDTYHSLSTYSDKGTAIVHLAATDAVYRLEFETLFKRPNKLRFGWILVNSRIPNHKQRSVIWSDGGTAWSSHSFHGNKPERKRDLELAVAGATGASWTTAHTIPRLLSDEVRGFRLDELQGLKITGNETADGVDCLVLVGYYATGDECKLWIGRKDYLVRRIEQRSKNSTHEEVRTQILVDQDIPDSRFSEQGH